MVVSSTRKEGPTQPTGQETSCDMIKGNINKTFKDELMFFFIAPFSLTYLLQLQRSKSHNFFIYKTFFWLTPKP
jgi:hypothetical protein